jgi:hypothetical protein
MSDLAFCCSVEGDEDGAHSEKCCAVAMLAGRELAKYEDVRRIAETVGERVGTYRGCGTSENRELLIARKDLWVEAGQRRQCGFRSFRLLQALKCLSWGLTIAGWP